MALPLPHWLGPRTVLQEVELLVLNDNNNASQGWTWQQIRGSLLQTHPPQQPQNEQNEQELANAFKAALRATLAELRMRGNLMTGVGGPQRYTLSDTPPYLPPWFTAEVVVQAVQLLDGIDAGGSTWAQVRDSLLQTHQPQQPQPPPGFVAVLRTMLSVLRQRGHLARGNNGPQHYTQQQAPALVQPNPIHISDFLWGYYLGYDLGRNDGLDHGVELGEVIANVLADDDSDEEMDEDA